MAKKGSSSGSKPHRGTHKRGRGRAPVRSHRWDRLDDNGRPDSAIDIVEHVGGENDSGGEGSEEESLTVTIDVPVAMWVSPNVLVLNSFSDLIFWNLS